MDNSTHSSGQPKKPGRKIVLCFDGTGDWGAVNTTNVMKIFQHLKKSEDQVVFYSGGVGTLAPNAISGFKRTFLKLLDLATATSLRDRVLEGYTFLVNEYREETVDTEADEIFMFGFSRGAFTARVLAALIHNFGLARKEQENLIPYLWQTISGFGAFSEFRKASAKIRDNFSRERPVEVAFLGLFDTVSSVGIFERFNIYPYTDRNPSVKVARHAVSKHETRNAFPELLLIPDLDKDEPTNDILEVWFNGVHRDVGGGASDHPGYEKATLNWMVEQATKFGLKFNFQHEPTEDAAIHVTKFDPYVLVGLYPMKMFDYRLNSEKLRRANPSLGWLIDVLRVNRKRSKFSKKQDGTPKTKAELEREFPYKNDPGFRWFWPNEKHERELPCNAYVVPDDKVVPDLPADARNRRKPAYKPRSGLTLLRDAVGILLGVALSVLIANRGLDNPLAVFSPDFKESWPKYAAQLSILFVVIFLIQQSASQWIKEKWKADWLNIGIQFGGLVAVGVLASKVWPWPTLVVAGGFSALIAIISLLGKNPLRADRVIPYFLVPWLSLVVIFWVVPPLLQFIVPPLAGAVDWLSYHLWQPKPDLSREAISYWLHWICWPLAALMGIQGMIHLIWDRKKMI